MAKEDKPEEVAEKAENAETSETAAETPKASSVEMGTKCEYKIYQERTKKDGSQHVVTVENFKDSSFDDDEKDRAYALTVVQTFNDKQQHEKTTVKIRSPHLLKAFRDVVGSYHAVASDFTKPFELESPFQILFHYWDDLDEYRQKTDDDDVRMHLNLLFEFMRAEIGQARERVQDMLAKGQISFKTAWTIFRPGDVLYLPEDGHAWLMTCEKTVYEESSKIGPYMEIHCKYTDFDGASTGQASHLVTIIQKRKFGGDSPAYILDLPIFPRKFVKESKEELEDKLVERGKKFLQLRETQTVYYDGVAKYLKEPPASYYDDDLEDRGGIWLSYAETGRVVLDRKTFKEDFHLEQVAVRHLDEPEPLYCPPYLVGFSVSRKSWCRFYVDFISDVNWRPNAWDTLILEKEQKHVLKALVSSHNYPENCKDTMAQKGKGLVMLLHGTPGSGKTLTAECAAEASHRPLIMSTLGELNPDNNDSWYFEYLLKRLLRYATTWKAVVLLDEADVFLEARDTVGGNAQRNALVAVFLKHLEFFSGIIFLTTNRIECFDPAMKSRIHLALGYRPPEMEIRRQLWLQHLSAIPPAEIGMTDIDDDVVEFLREKLNGREIAYAINTARTIARFEGVPLRVEHIHTVLKVRNDFDKSLRGTAKKLATMDMSQSVGSLSGGVARQNSILNDEAAEYLS